MKESIIAFAGFLLLFCAGCSGCGDSSRRLENDWTFRIDSLNQGLSEQWYLPEHSDSEWETVSLLPSNARHNVVEWRGVAWYRTTFEAEPTDGPRTLVFHGSDNSAVVWLNGERVGGVNGYSEWFAVGVTPSMRAGLNTLVVRVDNPRGYSGIYGPVSLTAGGTVDEVLKNPLSERAARAGAGWVPDAVVYGVFPRAFSREGTFQSLEQRLPEIKSLGATVLWLLPIHPIGDANRRGSLGNPYAVRDYDAINPEYGTLEDFRSLVRSAHGLGLRVVMDLVVNHAAWDSRLIFEHPDWFLHDESGAIVSPSAEWSDVAALDLRHHELRKDIIRMAEYWVGEVGVDGFRCHAAERVPTEFWELLRAQLEKIKPVMLISDGSLPDHHLKAFDVTDGGTMYRVFEALTEGLASPEMFHEAIRLESLKYPQGSLHLRYETRHDSRGSNSPAAARFGIKPAKLLSVLVYTMPGIPLIYNGDEAGNTARLGLFDRSSIDWTDRQGFRVLLKDLGRMRSEYDAFVRGTYRPLGNSEPSRVLSFARVGDHQVAVVVANLSADPVTVRVYREEVGAKDWRELNTAGDGRMGVNGEYTLLGWGWKIFIGTRTPT